MFRHMQNSEIIRKMTEEFDEVLMLKLYALCTFYLFAFKHMYCVSACQHICVKYGFSSVSWL